MEIKKVTDKEELLKVILFLKSAFGWSTNKANKLNKNLMKNNKELGVYGYCIKHKKDNILGALLIFYQGKKQYRGKKLKVINMASWYVSPKMRGYGSLKMIKTFIDDYSNYLITNLSSNNKAYKILNAFGFKDSTITNKKFTILSLIKNIDFLSLKLYVFIFNNFLLNSYLPQGKFSSGTSYSKKFIFEDSSINVVFTKTLWEKKISFLKFKIRGTRVLYTSNSKILSKYFYHIFFFNFLKNFSLFTTTHCTLDIPKRNQFNSSKQIYLAPYDNFKSNFEFAIRSELAFI